MAKSTEAVKVTLKELGIRVSEARDTEYADEMKRLRRHIRSNFDKLAPNWPGLTDAKSNADGNRYPPMPVPLAEALEARLTAVATPAEDTEGDEG